MVFNHIVVLITVPSKEVGEQVSNALLEHNLVPTVQAAHPYGVPEIIALPILMGSKSYLDWIDGSNMA